MIKQIRIQNFRSLVDISVDLDPLTVLIGRSGTGKTNFVHAIRFLRDCLHRRTLNFDSLGGPQRVWHVDYRNEPLAYDLPFSIPGFADRGENYLLVAEGILSDLSKSRSWKQIAKSMKAANRAVGSLTLNAPTPDRLDVGLQLNGRLLSFDVRQESEGFRRFLAHLL